MAEIEVVEEVRDVLLEQKRWMTSAEIYARCTLAEGRTTVSAALAELVRDRVVECVIRDDNTRRYGIDVDGGTTPVATPAQRRRGNQVGVRESIIRALSVAESPLTTRALCDATGFRSKQVGLALGQMAKLGRVIGESQRHRRGKLWRLPGTETEQPSAAPSPQAEPSGRSGPIEVETSVGRAPSCTEAPVFADRQYAPSPCEGGRRPRFSIRSDDRLRLELRDQDLLLDEADTRALLTYLEPWIRGGRPL